MLQTLRDSQESIGNLERLLSEGNGNQQRYQIMLREVEDKLGGLLENMTGDSTADS
jgi:hypothetical protein